MIFSYLARVGLFHETDGTFLVKMSKDAPGRPLETGGVL